MLEVWWNESLAGGLDHSRWRCGDRESCERRWNRREDPLQARTHGRVAGPN